ncbi:MAG: hypothetical protein FWE21_04120 [Defluviitaleaceae bacterium]|nr:hypothetical protein [Defluviitaleaceae bacterium]
MLKLCDFGSSVLMGRDYLFDRHWRVVRDTIVSCTKGLNSRKPAKKLLDEFEGFLKPITEQMKNLALIQNTFYDARVFTAPFKDYLERIESSYLVK